MTDQIQQAEEILQQEPAIQEQSNQESEDNLANQFAPRENVVQVNQNFQIESASEGEEENPNDQEVKRGIGAIKEAIVEQQKEETEAIEHLKEDDKKSVPNQSKSETKRIIGMATLERKTEAFEQSKSWEHTRTNQVQSHKQILESIWGRIQKYVNSSDEAMKFLVQYFRNRIDQEEYQLKCTSNGALSSLFKEFDGKIISSAYPEFSKAIRIVDQQTERQSDQLRILVAWLQNIIRERLDQEMSNFERQNKEMQSQFARQRKQLVELEKDVLKYFLKYEKLYLNMATKGKKYQKDFMNSELKYKFAAHRLIYYQREFGNWVLNAWADILALETQRLELVNQTIIDLHNQTMNCYGKLPTFDQTVQILNGLAIKVEVQTLYSQNNILSKQELEFIQNDQLQEVNKYLNNFQVVDKYAELSHPLILKIFQAQKDVGTLTKSWQDIGVIITVDHYFLVFQGKATRYARCESKYPLEGMKLLRKTNFEVELTFIIPGLVMDSKKKLLLQFHKNDELEELAYYLETVGQNKFAFD